MLDTVKIYRSIDLPPPAPSPLQLNPEQALGGPLGPEHLDCIKMLCSVVLLAGRRDCVEGSGEGDEVPLLHSWHPSGLGRQLWNVMATRLSFQQARCADVVCFTCLDFLRGTLPLVKHGLGDLGPTYCGAVLSCASRFARWPWCKFTGPSSAAAGRQQLQPQRCGGPEAQSQQERERPGAPSPLEGALDEIASSLLSTCAEALPGLWDMAERDLLLSGLWGVSSGFSGSRRPAASAMATASAGGTLRSVLGLTRLLLDPSAYACRRRRRGGPLSPAPRFPADDNSDIVRTLVSVRTAAKVLAEISQKAESSSSWGELRRLSCFVYSSSPSPCLWPVLIVAESLVC